MGKPGILGDIVFEVSDKTVLTLSKAQWSGAARYEEHERHGQNALTEFAGLGADKISFEMKLSASLGVKPMKELEKIWTYERTGATLPLVIGEHAYGKYRWTITGHTTDLEHYDATGNLLECTVKVELLEYLHR